MGILRKLAIALVVLLLVAGGGLYFLSRGDTADLSVEAVTGTDPTLAEPDPQSVPTVQVAKPVGWADGEAPSAADGLTVNRFAEGLDHPRVLYALPNGDVLVTLTRAPAKDEDAEEGGLMATIEGWVAEYLFEEAGAAGASANQIVLLRDADGDGVAEVQQTILDAQGGLDSPSGMSWSDGKLYVANHNAVMAFDYELGADAVTSEGEKLMDLPPGGGHWMRNLEMHPDGDRFFVAVGSVSNIGERGMDIEEGRAMIWEYTLESGSYRPFGAGLRNPNGLDFSPWSGELWTTVNERDMLGSDLVPDYLTNVPIGVQYGWPWVYYRDNIDRRVEAPMPRFLLEYTRRPVYAMGPHVAALGLVFTAEGHRMGDNMASGAFVARHGSWNRKPPSGYDVVYVAFDERGSPVGTPVPVLDGFLKEDGTTRGRPTWVEWGADGSLLVSDDTAGIIWRTLAPDAQPGAAIERIATKKVPPRPELRDPRADFEEDYLRQQSGQPAGN
ncbi:MAG: sorbosone dehydrogenase family protein [Pseudomonadota bacterium]